MFRVETEIKFQGSVIQHRIHYLNWQGTFRIIFTIMLYQEHRLLVLTYTTQKMPMCIKILIKRGLCPSSQKTLILQDTDSGSILKIQAAKTRTGQTTRKKKKKKASKEDSLGFEASTVSLEINLNFSTISKCKKWCRWCHVSSVGFVGLFGCFFVCFVVGFWVGWLFFEEQQKMTV